MLKGKKILILGGKPIGSCEIVQYAKSLGIHTTVADYLSDACSPAKKLADATLEISTANIAELEQYIIEHQIDGVCTGVHEFNIEQMITLCHRLNLPCVCSAKQWDMTNDKELFKQCCTKFGIPITKKYDFDSWETFQIESSEFPVIVKPSDGSGSRGFSICNNLDELKAACNHALDYSTKKKILIEKKMNFENSVIINYTIVNGAVYYGCMSDKSSKKVFDDGAPIMSLQVFPSLYEEIYLNTLNKQTIDMIQDIGLKNGVVWIEAFCDHGEFSFNEMGYRYGGSLTYYPVKKFSQIDQLQHQIEYALLGKNLEIPTPCYNYEKTYIILPIHLKAGKMVKVERLDEVKSFEEVQQIVLVHQEGDIIESWGSAQQVFAYIHIECNNKNELVDIERRIMSTLAVYNEHDENLLFNLYN